MTILSIAGLTSTADVSRIDGGVGYVRERTVEIGATVISADSIGTMVLIDGKKRWFLAFIGVVMTVAGLVQSHGGGNSALLLVLIGGALVTWNFLYKVDVCLSIGTCDGH